MTARIYLGVACACFLVFAGIQYGAWAKLLRGQLASPDPDSRRLALKRWIKFVLGWQLTVLLMVTAYILILRGSHARGMTWIAPAVAAIMGTALPLQLGVVSISRSARR